MSKINIMGKSIIIIFCFISILSTAKEKNSNPVWNENPVFSSIYPDYKKEKAVGIFVNENYEYYYSADGDLQCMHTIHKKFRLNTDEAVNNFNKISVSLANVIELTDLKARAIKPNGKVVNFDEHSIKEIKDEESGNSFKIFAIDGINVGDDVEYYVVRKIHASSFSRCFYQFNYPIQHGSFSLTSPSSILYALKGYNGFPNPTYSKLADERNHYKCHLDSIELIKGEKVAYLDPRRARIEWKLEYNLNKSNAQQLTWDDAAQTIYERTYVDIDKSKVKKWLKEISVQAGNQQEKAAQVEDYLKKNVFIQEYSMPEFDDIEYIFKNKVTNANGVVKLYANIYKELGIDHQLVVTSPRDKVKFDKDFQSWNYLDLYLIYLPESKTYIDPNNVAYRMGCIEGNLTATYGMFITPVSFDNFETAIAKVKYIEPTNHEKNFDHLHIVVDIDVENIQSRVQVTRGFKGLSGGFISNIYQIAEEEYKEGLLLTAMSSEATYNDYTKLEAKENTEIKFMNEAEFIICSDLTSHSFIEEAGNRILLNIGETIGQQVEMYFEENRNIVVENNFNRSYYREIYVNIPEGYKISNPEAADMSIVEEIEGKKQFGFESKHTIHGKQFKIVIDEYYKQIFAELKHFEGYKKVVNAAADFNKVVLVLEKE